MKLMRLLVFGLLAPCFFFPLPSLSNPIKPSSVAVASAHPLATRAGIDILKQGGNAFDAAIAVTAVLAVAEPYSSGLGGGGFYLLHSASENKQIMLDARERAPSAAFQDMYLDDNGEVIKGLSMNGPLAAAIPGIPAALDHLADRYGRLPLSTTLSSAIRIAEHGFEVTPRYQKLARFRLKVLRKFESSSHFLLKGEVPPLGHLIRQPELANTLKLIASSGSMAFYKGDLAALLIKGVNKAGGNWLNKDLIDYHVVARKPIIGQYRGIRVVSAAPPSSGGVVMMEALNILGSYDLQALSEPDRLHLIVEAMRRAYRDRAEYLGDPDYVDTSMMRLISQPHADQLRASIDMTSASPSESLPEVTDNPIEGEDTTHFSILDAEGNRVAATLSINYPFGSGFTAPGTGVLLNDEMDDFSSRPMTPNAYGLVGYRANEIEAGKRPLSSMSPTFLETKNRVAILGTPGGSRIISMVLLGILDFERHNSPESWVRVPRFHHQYLPDVIQHEPGVLSQRTINVLEAKGHAFKDVGRNYGNMQAILWEMDTNNVSAASDPRGEGAAQVVPVK